MPDGPDYFDRLLARHAAVPAAPRTTVRVRPRLPGPYERVEALRAEPPLPDEPAPLIPTAPQPVGGELIRHEREIRTDRHTVVRTETAPRDEPERAATDAPRPASPLLRPAAPVAPGPRPAAADGVRPERRAAAALSSADAPNRGAVSAPVRPDGVTALPPTAAGMRPSTTDATAARGAAARASAGRRGARPAERVVHVQIGRLEVSAAGTNGTPAARPEPARRRGPSLSLEDYLSRGEKRD